MARGCLQCQYSLVVVAPCKPTSCLSQTWCRLPPPPPKEKISWCWLLCWQGTQSRHLLEALKWRTLQSNTQFLHILWRGEGKTQQFPFPPELLSPQLLKRDWLRKILNFLLSQALIYPAMCQTKSNKIDFNKKNQVLIQAAVNFVSISKKIKKKLVLRLEKKRKTLPNLFISFHLWMSLNP